MMLTPPKSTIHQPPIDSPGIWWPLLTPIIYRPWGQVRTTLGTLISWWNTQHPTPPPLRPPPLLLATVAFPRPRELLRPWGSIVGYSCYWWRWCCSSSSPSLSVLAMPLTAAHTSHSSLSSQTSPRLKFHRKSFSSLPIRSANLTQSSVSDNYRWYNVSSVLKNNEKKKKCWWLTSAINNKNLKLIINFQGERKSDGGGWVEWEAGQCTDAFPGCVGGWQPCPRQVSSKS